MYASAPVLTWQVREKQDALIEAISQEAIPELLQYGHADTEWERGVAQQECVPQVKDLVQWEHICKAGTEINKQREGFARVQVSENSNPWRDTQ